MGTRQKFKMEIDRLAETYDHFVRGFLSGTRDGCPLEMLNQGSDATIKTLIAEYLGIPSGSQLRKVMTVHDKFQRGLIQV